jgi:hypothetical protein
MNGRRPLCGPSQGGLYGAGGVRGVYMPLRQIEVPD